MNVVPKMHSDELEIDDALVRDLLGEQFPEWVDLPLRRIEPMGTVNAIFRLGDELSVRLARREGPTQPGGKEFDWLPRLAPLLPVEIPVPVAQGRPTGNYPWFWEIHRWVEGETVPVEEMPPWDGPPVWHHGDLDARNWLVRDGHISGVIDWGSMGVGDPACDAMMPAPASSSNTLRPMSGVTVNVAVRRIAS
jgi:aminoglycoside phosphotransferase (APT) family kinase protein